jgi:hypothetical protein
MPDEQQAGQQYDTSQLDTVEHPTLGTLKFPKAMPPEERNASIEQMEKQRPVAQTPEQLAAAKQRNAAPTQFEKENTPTVAGEAARTAVKIPLKTAGLDTNSQSPVSDWLKSNAGAALDFVRKTTPPGMIYDALRGKGPQMPAAVSSTTNQMDDLSREARAEVKTGQSVEPAQANQTGAYQSRPGGPVQRLGAPLEHPFLSAAMKEASSMVPVVGPAASRAGHELARATTLQEKGEALADAGGAAGQGFLATEPGQKFANEAIEKIGGPVNRGIVKPISEGVSNVTSRLRTPEAQEATTQAIQPSVNIPNAQRSISVAGPRIQQLKADGMLTDLEGNPIHEIKSPGDLVSASRAAQKHIIGAIEDRLGPVADLQQDTAGVAKDVRASVSKRVREQFPEQAAAIDKRAATYEKPRSLRDINDAIIDANDDLKGMYNKPVQGESSTSASIKATQAEVKQLRQILDKGVENLSGSGVADLKREWGAQRDVERAAARQHAVATRTKGANLWEGLAALHAAGDLVSGNLLGAVRGAATMAVGKRLAVLRDPNYLLDKAFQGDKAFKAADRIPVHAGPPPPKGLLPRPPIEMPSGDQDTSGPVRGARYTTPKAALPGESPIEAEFIPRRVPTPPARAGISRMLPETAGPKTTIPPAVSPEFAREAVQAAQPNAVRIPPGSRELPAPAQAPRSGPPPSVSPQFAREVIGSISDANKLGARGEGGVRVPPTKGLLPGGGTAATPLKVTNEMGIRWAHSPDGEYRVSIPKSVSDAELQSYATKKLAEQKTIHEGMPKAVNQ